MSPTFLAWRKCEACGFEANEPVVQPSVAKMPDKLDGRGRVIEAGPYLDVIRCRDVPACEQRCADAGREYPFQQTRWTSFRRDDR